MAYQRITEIKRIKVDTECKDNPVYLAWLNTSGSYSYWLFEINNTKQVQTEALGEFTKNIPDLATSVGNKEFLMKISQPAIIVGANVSRDDMDGLTGLINSPKVQMLMNPDTWAVDGAVWQRVQIKPGSFVTGREVETRMDVELVILTAQTNIQAE
jgi:hypothetical protein